MGFRSLLPKSLTGSPKSVYTPDICEAYIIVYKPMKLDSVNQSKPRADFPIPISEFIFTSETAA